MHIYEADIWIDHSSNLQYLLAAHCHSDEDPKCKVQCNCACVMLQHGKSLKQAEQLHTLLLRSCKVQVHQTTTLR